MIVSQMERFGTVWIKSQKLVGTKQIKSSSEIKLQENTNIYKLLTFHNSEACIFSHAKGWVGGQKLVLSYNFYR